MTENYKQIDQCFISYRAHNVYSTLPYEEQVKVKPFFKVISTGSPEVMPLIKIPGVEGNYRWRYTEKYSFILKTFMGRFVLEDIIPNAFLDQIYAKS